MISAAWPYVFILAVPAALLLVFHHPLVGSLVLGAAVSIALFFRDPERRIPPGENLVVSPADGRIVEVRPANTTEDARVAIFLSLFDVHVNRSPIQARVVSVSYSPGAFRPAYDPQASSTNERNTLSLEGPAGKVDVSQIAGIVARRIHCFKKRGDAVDRGERIGYIAFGSRTELTLPAKAEIVVSVGDRVRGGETVIARLPGGQGKM
jgi:phosphatidylserine decarboxylase